MKLNIPTQNPVFVLSAQTGAVHFRMGAVLLGSGIEQSIVCGGDVVAQTVEEGAAVLGLELTSAGCNGEYILFTKPQTAAVAVHIGDVAVAVTVRTGDIFIQCKAVEENIGS